MHFPAIWMPVDPKSESEWGGGGSSRSQYWVLAVVLSTTRSCSQSWQATDRQVAVIKSLVLGPQIAVRTKQYVSVLLKKIIATYHAVRRHWWNFAVDNMHVLRQLYVARHTHTSWRLDRWIFPQLPSRFYAMFFLHNVLDRAVLPGSSRLDRPTDYRLSQDRLNLSPVSTTDYPIWRPELTGRVDG